MAARRRLPEHLWILLGILLFTQSILFCVVAGPVECQNITFWLKVLWSSPLWFVWYLDIVDGVDLHRQRSGWVVHAPLDYHALAIGKSLSLCFQQNQLRSNHRLSHALLCSQTLNGPSRRHHFRRRGDHPMDHP